MSTPEMEKLSGLTGKDGEESLRSSLQEDQKIEILLLKIIQGLQPEHKSFKEHLCFLLNLIIDNWPFPFSICIKLVYKKNELLSGNYRNTINKSREELNAGKKGAGYIEIGYLTGNTISAQSLEKETTLVKAISRILIVFIEKHRVQSANRKITLRLKEKIEELERKQLALKEILGQIGNDKDELNDNIQANLKKIILPAINKLKTRTMHDEIWKKYIEILEINLHEITTAFTNKMGKEDIKLSPREQEICNLIVNGYHTKEIAQFLQISILTVERHRFNIRKKLGLKKNQVNLRTFLQKY